MYKLIEDSVEFIINTDRTAIAFLPQSKKTRAAIIRDYNDYRMTATTGIGSILSPTFKLKFDTSLSEIFCKWDDNQAEWIKVLNFDIKFLGNLIIKNKFDINTAEFEDRFMIAVDESTGDCIFVVDTMEEYNLAFNEMTRQLMCNIKSRTSKWIPGHRYDSETSTIYYLGSFPSYKQDELASEFSEDQISMVHLVCTNCRGLKKISDVFKQRTFGNGDNDIRVLTKASSMVDSGAILENDIADLSDCWESIFNNAWNSYKQEKISLRRIFDIFCYTRNHNLPETIKQPIITELRNICFSCFIEYWNIPSGFSKGYPINSTQSLQENVDNLGTQVISKFQDPNILSKFYYQGLFKSLGIDFSTIIENIINSCSDPAKEICSSFEIYLEYGKYYFKFHDKDRVSRITNFSEFADYGNGPLKEVLGEMLEDAKETFGVGCSEFFTRVEKVKNAESTVYIAGITVFDIIKWKKGVLIMDNSLKDDIMSNKFWQVYIEFEKQ